jgi:transposase
MPRDFSVPPGDLGLSRCLERLTEPIAVAIIMRVASTGPVAPTVVTMKAYPLELRQRIVAAVDRGVGSLPTVAALFGVSLNCVANYLRLRTDTDSLQPRPNPGGRPPAIPPDRYDELRRLLTEQPHLTLAQLRDALRVECSLAAVCRTLHKVGLTRQQKSARRRAAPPRRPGAAGRGG